PAAGRRFWPKPRISPAARAAPLSRVKVTLPEAPGEFQAFCPGRSPPQRDDEPPLAYGSAPAYANAAMAHGTFSLSSFAIRLLVSLFVVLATYNPTGYSLVHWLIDRAAGPLSLKLLASIGLATLYSAVFRLVLAAFRLPGLT